MMIDCTRVADLGEAFSPSLYQVEVDYLIRHEFARSAQDIVWRRTRQGIGMNTLQFDRLAEYIEAYIHNLTKTTLMHNYNGL